MKFSWSTCEVLVQSTRKHPSNIRRFFSETLECRMKRRSCEEADKSDSDFDMSFLCCCSLSAMLNPCDRRLKKKL